MSRNVDAAEIAKFDALAQSWWDERGSSRLLHDLNPVRLGYIKQRAQLRGARVLDVGCGGGILSESLSREGAIVTAIDLAEGALSVARLHAIESGLAIDYRAVSVEELSLEAPNSFDIVICMEMLEHVPAPESVIRAMAQIAEPGASVFVSTINRNARAFVTAIIGAELIARALPRGTHEYRKFIKPSELAAEARRAGLELEDTAGIGFNPLLQTFSLGTDVSVNYLAHFKRREIERGRRACAPAA